MPSAKTIGLVMLAIGSALPVLTYIGARMVLAADASLGGPPNQGAMVQAFFCVVASIVVGVLIASAGVFTLVRASRPPSKPGDDRF
jgi:hypothetical protein